MPVPVAVSGVPAATRIVGGRAPLGVVGEPLEARAGVDRAVLSHVALEPGDDGGLDVTRGSAPGQAHAVAAAEPHHLVRHAVGLDDRVVVDRLTRREQRVRRALDDERRDGDLLDEVAGAAGGEPGAVLGAQRARGGAADERGGDVRVQAALRGRHAQRVERRRPAALDGLLLVERGQQRVPGDDRGDRVDALVQRGRRELDAAGVGDAGHAHARVAGPVELGLGLRREPVDQRHHVARLLVGRVDGDRAARVAEPARVPRQHVEAGLAQRADADVAGALVAGRVRVGLARPAPAVALEDRRRLAASRRRMEREHDLGPVEGRDRGAAGLGGGGGDQSEGEGEGKGAHGSALVPAKFQAYAS